WRQIVKRLVQWWKALLRRSAISWTLLSFVVVYAAFLLLGGDIWLRMWLKGSSYVTYQATFAVSFVIIYSFVAARQRHRTLGPVTWAAIGSVVGFACGVLGHVAIAMSMTDGADRILRTVERSGAAEILFVLVVPAILLNWLVGLIVGATTFLALREAAAEM